MKKRSPAIVLSLLASIVVPTAGCSGDETTSDAAADATATDARAADARADGARADGTAPDASASDARADGTMSDSGTSDASDASANADGADARADAAPSDAGTDATTDAAVTDGGPTDSGITDAASDGTATYKTFATSSNWESFTLQPAGQVSPISGFYGAVFDGRYIYLVPNGSFHGKVVRFDTTASFTAATSYTLFDLATVNAQATGFKSGAFDGRYVYLTQGHPGGRMARYDTQANFTTAGSWEFMDPTTVDQALTSFWQSTAFDGRYVYYGPFSTHLLRYDTQGAFTAAGSWDFIDGSIINGAVSNLSGVVFDGTYVNYFGGASVRFAASGTFTSLASWQTNGSGAGAYGVYDGRYIWTGPASGGIGFQYDPQGSPYPSRRSYVTGAGTVNVFGGVTDGKFLFFAPSGGSLVARIDPTLVYAPDGGTGTGATTTFNLTGIGVSATSFAGAAFDGRYVYLVPRDASTFVRFDAKEPKAMPASYKGSFL
jgi:hypothetical protein